MASNNKVKNMTEYDYIKMLNVLSPEVINKELQTKRGGRNEENVFDQFLLENTNLLLNISTNGHKNYVESLTEVPSNIMLNRQFNNMSLESGKKGRSGRKTNKPAVVDNTSESEDENMNKKGKTKNKKNMKDNESVNEEKKKPKPKPKPKPKSKSKATMRSSEIYNVDDHDDGGADGGADV